MSLMICPSHFTAFPACACARDDTAAQSAVAASAMATRLAKPERAPALRTRECLLVERLLAHPALQIRQTRLRVGVARGTIRGAPERIELGDVRAIGVERILRRTTFRRGGGIHATRESLELRRHLGGLALDKRDLLLERRELALEHRDALRVLALELGGELHRLGVVDPRRELAAPAHGGELGALTLELRAHCIARGAALREPHLRVHERLAHEPRTRAR